MAATTTDAEKMLPTTDEKAIILRDESRTSSVDIIDQTLPVISTAAPTDNVGLTGAKLYGVVGALTLVVLMIALDVTIVATAVPKITDYFHTIKDVGWYSAAYILSNSSLQPLTGKVFTYFNITYSYLCFIAVFELGSIICAVASSSTMLVIGRAVAGMGASGLVNGALTMVGVAAAPSQRPMLLGVIMAFFGAGQILGPIIGGVLTERASWRWCFWINLPIGAAAGLTLFMARIINPNRRRDLTKKTFFSAFDIAGWVLFSPACIMLLIGLEWGGTQHAWNSATIIGLLCGSLVTFMLFILWERRKGESAMFPGSLMGRTVIWSSCLSSAFSTGGLLVVSYYLPLWFQAVKRNSPIESAIHILPLFVSQIIGGMFAAIMVSKVGYYTPFAISGAMFSAIGAGLMTMFTPTTGLDKWLGFQVLVGLGRGLGLQQAMTAVQNNIPDSQMSTAMAVTAWSQLIGGAVIISLAQTMFTNILRTTIPSVVPGINPAAVIGAGATNYVSLASNETQRSDLIRGYNHAVTSTYYLCVGCAAVAMVAAFGMGWKKVPKKTKKAKKSKSEAKAEA